MNNNRSCRTASLLLVVVLAVAGRAFADEKAKVSPAHEHYQKGMAARNAQDYAGAVAEFRKAVELDPKYRQAHEGLATAAYFGYQHAMRSASQDKTATPGAVAAAERQLNEVRDFYLQSSKRDPNKAVYQYALGVLSGNDFNAKERYFLRAVELDRTMTQVYPDLAYDADLRGDDQAQLKYLKKASATDPVWSVAYARKLQDVDFAAQRKLLREVMDKYQGQELGAQASGMLAEVEPDVRTRIGISSN